GLGRARVAGQPAAYHRLVQALAAQKPCKLARPPALPGFPGLLFDRREQLGAAWDLELSHDVVLCACAKVPRKNFFSRRMQARIITQPWLPDFLTKSHNA